MKAPRLFLPVSPSNKLWPQAMPSVMDVAKCFRVGTIIGSQRVLRIGPQVAQFVLDTIKTSEASYTGAVSSRPSISFDLIDIKEHNLPLFDEPNIPNQIKSPEDQ